MSFLHSNTHPDHWLSKCEKLILLLKNNFKDIYQINSISKVDWYGRYPEDIYYGGNPWVICTVAKLTFQYKYKLASRIYILDQFNYLWEHLESLSDQPEQIDRNDGSSKSARYLTWNCVELLDLFLLLLNKYIYIYSIYLYMSDDLYYLKYLKYKSKYLKLKNKGGSIGADTIKFIKDYSDEIEKFLNIFKAIMGPIAVVASAGLGGDTIIEMGTLGFEALLMIKDIIEFKEKMEVLKEKEYFWIIEDMFTFTFEGVKDFQAQFEEFKKVLLKK